MHEGFKDIENVLGKKVLPQLLGGPSFQVYRFKFKGMPAAVGSHLSIRWTPLSRTVSLSAFQEIKPYRRLVDFPVKTIDSFWMTRVYLRIMFLKCWHFPGYWKYFTQSEAWNHRKSYEYKTLFNKNLRKNPNQKWYYSEKKVLFCFNGLQMLLIPYTYLTM